MLPRIDGKIRAQMWSVTRATALLVPLLLIACKKDEVGPGACPAGTALLQDVCRKSCTADADCLLNEFCDPGPDACMPEPVTDMPKIKVFEVAPVPVALGESVAIDFGVVSSDRLRIEVLWSDSSTSEVLDTTSEYFGTKLLENITQSGVVKLTASKNGVTQEQTRPIEVDDGSPRLVKFEVDQSRVAPGTTVQLTWQVENANAPIEIAIEGGAVLVADAPEEGQHSETVFDNTAFTLASGELFARVTVDVLAPEEPQVVLFEQRGPNPAPHDYPIALVWETTNAIEATVEVDGNEAFTVRSPAEVDRGAVAAILPSGLHRVQLTVTGLLQQKASSPELEVYFVSDRPPSIGRFDHPLFLEANGGDVTVAWSILTPDPIATEAFFAWSDLQVGFVGLDDQATHPATGETILAGLRGFSPAGAAEARGVIFAVIPEAEPNDEHAGAQPIGTVAVDGATNALDPDFFLLGAPTVDQTIVATIYGPCPLGISLAVTDDAGNGATYISSADGDCPTLEVRPQTGDRWFAAVSHSLADPAMPAPYRLAVQIRDPICGDGFIASIEQCDDGGLINGDGCSADCLDEDVVFYSPGGSARPAEVRPPTARAIGFHPYPGGGLPEDDGFGIVEIPSSFTFFERTYHAAIVHADGSVSFSPDPSQTSFDPTRPLDASGPNDVIAAVGADLRRAGPGSGVYSWIIDSGGVAIEYENFVLVGHPTSRVDFRIVLEPNGEVWIGYASIQNIGLNAEFQAGLQDRKGGRTVYLPGCDPSCSAESGRALEGQFFQMVPGS